MPIPVQICLTLGPLATYFLVLGAWQSGRDAKVVPGGLDFALLALGVGGLVAFGPIGTVLIRLLFPGESVWAWLALPTTLALAALMWAPKMRRRVVVYNVSPEDLERVAREVADHLPGRVVSTLRGYEDRARPAAASGWTARAAAAPRSSRPTATTPMHSRRRSPPSSASVFGGPASDRRLHVARMLVHIIVPLATWVPMITAISIGQASKGMAEKRCLKRLQGG